MAKIKTGRSKLPKEIASLESGTVCYLYDRYINRDEDD